MIFYATINNSLFLLRLVLNSSARQRRLFYPYVLGLLFVISAFRFEVGCDWDGYLFQWQAIEYEALPWQLRSLEPFWWVGMSRLQDLGFGYLWLNVVTSIVFFCGIHGLAQRQPDSLGFLVLLFPVLIINMPMSAVQQAAAMGLLCFSYLAFVDERRVAFVLWTVAAGATHSSALVFLFLAPLIGGGYTKKSLLLAMIMAVPGTLIMLQTASATLAFERYVDSNVVSNGAIYRVGLVIATGILYFMVLRKHWKRAFPRDYSLISVSALMMIGLALLMPVSNVIADRFAYYLLPLQCLIFARIPYLVSNNALNPYGVLPYLAFTALFMVWLSKSWHFGHCYAPYDTWLFGVPRSAVYAY